MPNLFFRKSTGLIPADFQGLQSVKYQIHLKKTSFTFPSRRNPLIMKPQIDPDAVLSVAEGLTLIKQIKRKNRKWQKQQFCRVVALPHRF
jgi:hypothetical protein